MHPGIPLLILSGAALVFCSRPAARADVLTQSQTAFAYTDPANSSNHQLKTNWDTETTSAPGLQTPEVSQFNPSAGALQQVNITVSYSLQNLYTLQPTTPSTVTMSAIDPNHPDMSPAINVGGGWPLSSFRPGFQIAPSSDQAAGLSRSITMFPGQTPTTYSSYLAPTDPHYVPPFNFDPSFTTTLKPGDADFSKFLGSGQVSFPFTAQGVSTFNTTSGNCSGGVDTLAGSAVTVTYSYVPNAPDVAEPASVILFGVGGSLWLVSRVRRPRKGPTGSESGSGPSQGG